MINPFMNMGKYLLSDKGKMASGMRRQASGVRHARTYTPLHLLERGNLPKGL